MTKPSKEIVGAPIVIGGRELTLSKAVRAGDFVFLTGQVPMRNGHPMTSGSVSYTHLTLPPSDLV